MVEVGVVASAGAVLGLALGALGLRGMRALYAIEHRLRRGGYAGARARRRDERRHRASLLAFVATLAAGLYPAWRIGRIPPAAYLKNQ